MLQDGRKRAVFILANVLKPDYKDRKEELVKLLQDWYKYTGGKARVDIEKIVGNNLVYRFSDRYLMDFIEEIGAEEAFEKWRTDLK